MSDYECLSARAQETIAKPAVSFKYNKSVMDDLYCPRDNPQGYVDLGLAENKLCEDVMTNKLKTIPSDTDLIPMRYYADFAGMKSFRESIKVFIQREFKSIHTLHADQFVTQAGVTSLLDAIAFAVAGPGDYIMSPAPYYYRVKDDFIQRAGVKILEVPLYNKSADNAARPYSIQVADVETEYLKAVAEGKVVKGFVLINPNNPLGTVCTRQEIADILDFCAKYKLHFIADEIYALSVFDDDVTFTSVLSLPHPDPNRTHFIWGCSKDLGLSGYRCGVLWSANKKLIDYLTAIGIYQMSPALVQRRLQYIVDDVDWMHKEYIPTLKSRLKEHFCLARDELEKCGVYVTPAVASIFVWFDCSKFLTERSHEEEMRVFELFMSEKVFVLPGQLCYSREPGCFRMIFSTDKTTLMEGLRRVTAVLKKLKKQ